MVKQSVQFKWTNSEKGAFDKIKTSTAHEPSLKSPNFEKDFILYTFASDNSLAVVLTQKEEGGDEYPISFMSTGLQWVKLNYPMVDKQDYVVFKVVNQFRLYILKNRTKVIVPHSTVRSLFIKKELGERPETIVKGKGL